MRNTVITLCASVTVTAVLSACGNSGKTYDISPIFPATPNKCAKYHGEEKGSGITASCMVTRGECEKAAAEWRTAMATGGVTDAIEFSCK
jgi:hypothetical protein